MGNSLRKLFILSVVAAAGLFCLQAWWITQGWKNSRDILERQVDYSFQTAVDKELRTRHDTLYQYLSTLIKDSTQVGVRAQFDTALGKWSVFIYDPHTPGKNKVSWVEEKIPAANSTPEQIKQSVYNRLLENLKKQVTEQTVIFYTQSFGFAWRKKSENLRLDTLLLQDYFKEELSDKNINAAFSIRYIDTSVTNPAQVKTSLRELKSEEKTVFFKSLAENEHNYAAVATIHSPVWLVLQKLWITLLATLLLVSLTIFCLYRMYKTILQQKQLNEIKNDFIGNMTHELKTPIATITAAVDALQYFGAMRDEEKQTRYLETSRKELLRLNDIVSKVMELSLYETGRIRLQKEPVGLIQLFASVMEHITLQQEDPTQVNWEIKGEEITVMADQTHLTNVFYNLVENAVKYVADLKLTFSVERNNNTATIILGDNGKGMDEAHLPFIFDKFYRVPSGNLHETKGFGLGLFYVKKIIEAHGGSIVAESRENEGTKFTIQLTELL